MWTMSSHAEEDETGYEWRRPEREAALEEACADGVDVALGSVAKWIDEQRRDAHTKRMEARVRREG